MAEPFDPARCAEFAAVTLIDDFTVINDCNMPAFFYPYRVPRSSFGVLTRDLSPGSPTVPHSGGYYKLVYDEDGLLQVDASIELLVFDFGLISEELPAGTMITTKKHRGVDIVATWDCDMEDFLP